MHCQALRCRVRWGAAVNDPIRATLTLRNNRLICLREDLGISQKSMSVSLGLSFGILCGYETLKTSPIGRNAQWKGSAMLIADFHGASPEYLWPEAVQNIQKTEVTTTIQEADIAFIEGRPDSVLLPDEIMSARELSNELEDAMQQLKPRQREIIRARQDGKTLGEVGKRIGLSRERTRQLEVRGLRELRELLDPDGEMRESCGLFK